jgi:segregation and condensation protein A
MTRTPASEAIAVLIELAQKGEIDPWDVQVIEVIDRFLEELGILGDGEPSYQDTDLLQSGQAFLWASMLVLLKADTLEQMQREEEEGEGEALEEELADSRELPPHLESHIRRRLGTPPTRKRRVTLQELIDQLEKIAVQIETKPSTPIPRQPRPHSRQEALRLVTELAHNENLTELAGQLEDFLAINLSQLINEEKELGLEQLLEYWSVNSQQLSKDRVGIFWALLLLSAQSKVELSQEEFYGELKIKPLTLPPSTLRVCHDRIN